MLSLRSKYLCPWNTPSNSGVLPSTWESLACLQTEGNIECLGSARPVFFIYDLYDLILILTDVSKLHLEVDTIINPILQRRKLRFKKVSFSPKVTLLGT